MSHLKKIFSYHSFLPVQFVLILLVGIRYQSIAQIVTPGSNQQAAPDTLSGNGAKQFDFFYAGESKERNMYIVRNGRITWSYTDTTGRGEISDAILMKNGNILFAHQFGITLINRNKKVLWNYDTPEGCETHTAQFIGNDRVIFVQNGNPAKVIVMNIRSNAIEKEFAIPSSTGVHGQVRHARLTAAGTYVIALMSLGKICEFDVNGKVLLSLDVPDVWSAVPLQNGNLLVASNQGFVREINRSGDIVWDYPLAGISRYKITNPQLATRLPNGNTLINNWFNQWNSHLDSGNAPVQAIEVTPDKEIVWALRSWKEPLNLGPSTTIQILNNPGNTNGHVHFGEIR